jgi:hypothetical protein
VSDSKNATLVVQSENERKSIFAFLGARNIGDFTEQLIVAAAVKENLGGYRLAVYYKKDKPYKEQIIWLYPGIE